MKFDLQKKERKNFEKYFSQDIQIARKFAKIMYREFGTFMRALVVFGSTVSNPSNPSKDIDILVILDDVRIQFTRDLVQTYRIITEKAIAQTDPKRLHIQSMKFTSFWEYVRAGDPVAINILRHGVSIIDTGFFDPLQMLLEQGRIRPSDESIYTYFTLSPKSLHRAQQHILTAVVDLYWAGIDAAHAALMTAGQIPPSPDHVADLLEKTLVKNKEISPKYADTMRKLYRTFKRITRREISFISGKEYDKLRDETEIFVDEMRKYIEKKKKEKII
ncbi:MAG: nucleotidyltransferase domain-containing protein [Nanoarchaeota archaeon]